MTVEESLQTSFDASLTDLLTAYGKAVGVPALTE
jgi:hypothetical protein